MPNADLAADDFLEDWDWEAYERDCRPSGRTEAG